MQGEFYLKINGNFYAQADIAVKLDWLQQTMQHDEILRETPDGAISMVYQGKELFGLAIWDYLPFLLYDPFFALDAIFMNEIFEVYLPMQSTSLVFSKCLNQLCIEMNSPTQHLRYDAIPFQLFVERFSYSSLVLIRLMALCGAQAEARLIQDWQNHVPQIAKTTLGEDVIQDILVHRPIQNLLVTKSP